MEQSIAVGFESQGTVTESLAEREREVPPQRTEEFETTDLQQSRVVGSPLPVGGGTNGSLPHGQGEPKRLQPAPPPGRSLTNRPAPAVPSGQPSGLQRAVNAVRVALPFVQRMLPLLDGNFATTVSNILSPPQPPQPPPAPVDLAPVQNGLAELQMHHRELREQVLEQNASLKRVEDHLEMVREATDRNTLEQQELLEDLKSVGSKVNLVAVIAIGLLAISVLLNLLLYMHIQRVLP
jgi:hypothetical protein